LFKNLLGPACVSTAPLDLIYTTTTFALFYSGFKIFWAFGWIVFAGIGTSILYGLWDSVKIAESISPELAGFYNGVSRPLWTMCVAWVIIACTEGNGGKIILQLIFWPSWVV